MSVRDRFRGALLALGVSVGAGVAALSLAPHLPVLLWNATASAPLGFYRISPAGALQVGDWVALRPSRALAAWLAAGRYLPPNVPLLKQVAATEGRTVCRHGDRILVDGRFAAAALSRDRRGARLPSWRGCRVLGADEIFLLNTTADSLDGRYFGPSRGRDLIGRAEPLWTWSARP